jgi:hypothetical protein
MVAAPRPADARIRPVTLDAATLERLVDCVADAAARAERVNPAALLLLLRRISAPGGPGGSGDPEGPRSHDVAETLGAALAR